MSLEILPIVPAMYFGPVEVYRLFAKHSKVIVDLGEHYERQSYRTRTTIVGPNGAQDLVVQIARRSGEKMPMHSVGLCYVESWPEQHMHAIRSAYGRSPWYIHFCDDLGTLITTRYERLVDLDLASMRLCLKWLGLRTELILWESYVDASAIPGALDLRGALNPKKPLPATMAPVPDYPQVFADRHGFQARMSIVDLLCNAGPQVRQLLQK